MALVKMRNESVERSAMQVTEADSNQPVLISADLGLFGDIRQDLTYLSLFALQAYVKSRQVKENTLRFRFEGSDAQALSAAKEHLAKLEADYGIPSGRLTSLFVEKAPKGYNQVHLVQPTAAVSQKEGHRYIPIQPATPGDVVSYQIFLAYKAGQLKIEQGRALDPRFVESYEAALGKSVDQKRLRSVIEGYGPSRFFTEYALPMLVKVDLQAMFQFSKNMLKALGSSA
jgi:hypothetical protein